MCFSWATLWKRCCYRVVFMTLIQTCTLTSFTMTSFEHKNFKFLRRKECKFIAQCCSPSRTDTLSLSSTATTWWKTTKIKVDREQVEWRWERDRPWSHCLASITTCFVLQIMIEGVKAGPSEEGDMAFDDVLLLDAQCSYSEHCDFESNMCSWSNIGSDQDDWFRRRGNSRGPPGPSVDHTTLTPFGQLYL